MKATFLIYVVFAFSILQHVTSENEDQKVECFDVEIIKQKGEELLAEHKNCWDQANRTLKDYIICVKTKIENQMQEDEFNFEFFLIKKFEIIKQAKQQLERDIRQCWDNEEENDEYNNQNGSITQQMRKATKCFWTIARKICVIPFTGPGGIGGPPPPPPDEGNEWTDN